MSTETLMPDVDVMGHNVRPWSLGQIAKVGPHISHVLGVAQRLGFDFTPALRGGLGALDQVTLTRVLLESGDAVVHILAISLKQPVEQVEEMAPAESIALLKAVFVANKDHLKNSLAPMLAGAARNATTAP